FKKVLGWGGLGLAALYSVQEKLKGGIQRKHRFDIVVKFFLPEAVEDFEGEKKNHVLLARSRHVVQLVPIKKPPKGALEESTATLFLEVMGRGNLHSWICKMGQADRFSDKALWLMFDCLFKGVVGMAHPPKLARKEEYEKTGGKWDRTHFDEQIPFWDVANKTSNDLVHFDLDPINILVGDFNVGRDKAHTMIPIMKVADLGLMNEMKDHREGNAEMMWGVRTCGKAFDGWLAPEQFHEEWDYLRNPLPDREYDPKTKPKTAGKYSWRTNVYWLGLVMFTLVTRMYAPLEPIPYSLGQVYVTDERTGRVKRRDPWSYGGYLMHDNFKDKVDRDLLMAVTCCMCDDPEHRPSLKELSDMITFKISQKWPSETDDQTRQWAAGFFSEP
ncbi:kinase-like domain-containing protein, partial [Cladorrhinum sp. PSN259]